MSSEPARAQRVPNGVDQLEAAIRDLGDERAAARADAANVRRLGRLLVASMQAWHYPGDETFTATFSAQDWQNFVAALDPRNP